MGYADSGASQKDTNRLEEEIHLLRSQLSESPRLEEQLRQAQKMEALANLAGGIAHDFNNILQTILCYMQLSLLKSDDMSPEDTYKRIEPIINKGSDLAKQLMAFGRPTESETISLDLNWKIRETRKILDRTIPKMIRIDLALDEHLDRISADGGQIEQVLMNMGVNAKDAMPEGGTLAFATEKVRSGKDPFLKGINAETGNYVLLKISDTGCGISNSDMQHIFDPFFTTKKKGEGTGLGLSVVYAIVKNHKGFINCCSVSGKGTTFNIYLPVADAETKKSKVFELRRNEAVSGGDDSILLVDDEQTILEVWGELLESYGYRVTTAVKGEEALWRYANSHFDLVLLDLNMPGMGGLKFFEKLLAMDHQAKVVMSSGYSMNGLVKKGFRMGAKAFLPKPYSIDRLLHTIRETLDADACVTAWGATRKSTEHVEEKPSIPVLPVPRPAPVPT
ncbi:MAG: response regulator [Deltaproteobacteria bacterium]|nr:response regulator [Deltaproteobacteria bacterium]